VRNTSPSPIFGALLPLLIASWEKKEKKGRKEEKKRKERKKERRKKKERETEEEKKEGKERRKDKTLVTKNLFG
jgi:uncharacterized protein (DUF302 family)